MDEERIGVLGGGISGLTFASLIKNSEVVEKEEKLGGLAKSIKDSGYTFDLGSHIIFSRNKEVLDFMTEILGENKIEHRRNTKIIYKGIKVKYPFENGLGDLPKEEAFECITDYAETYVKREKKELEKPKNFKEWMYYRFGKAITEKYLYPYNVKVWDYPPEKMDIFWVEGRVPQPPLKEVIKAAMKIESEGYLHQLNFYYPEKGGYNSIIDALEKKVGKERITTSYEVNNVKKESKQWIINSGENEKVFDKIVSTMHIKDFINAYENSTEEVKEAANNLKWNSIYLVMIGVNKPKITDMHWVYSPDKERIVNRISFPSNFSPNVTPEGHSAVLAEITFYPRENEKKNEKEILEKTINDLHEMKIFNKEDVVFTKLIKCPYAYVIYDLEYQKNIKIIEEFVKKEGITLLGRFSEFKYYNADKCIERAMETAKLFL